MTTYDLQSASRRALQTIEASLSSEAGSLRSPTVRFKYTEERLAARLVSRLGVVPPVDVESVARRYATVTNKRFPVELDGLCLDLKVPGKRPKIWISAAISRVRRRFTLAHEIGHIIIPWHVGMIADDVDVSVERARSEYHEMEAEANRFAAELLMPTEWVMRTIERTSHAAVLMKHVATVADVSLQAAFLRVARLAPAGFIGAEVRDGRVKWALRTPGTRAWVPPEGTEIEAIESAALHKPRTVGHGSHFYMWWKVRDVVAVSGAPEEPWRHILERILSVVEANQRDIIRSRVNAVIGSAFGSVRSDPSAESYYAAALQSTQNRHDRDRWLKMVFSHPEFDSYLIARCHFQAKRH